MELNVATIEGYTEPLLIPLGIVSPQVTCTAILDSGVDVNVMSAQLYEGLQTNQLLPSTARFNSFSNHQTDCKGVLTTSIFIHHRQEPCISYVSNTNESAHEVILGHSWMAQHNCSIDWEKHAISLTMCNHRFIVCSPRTPHLLSSEAQSIAASIRPCVCPNHKQPRSIYKQNTANPPRAHQVQHQIKQRWIPLKLLQAQGYYKGKTLIWILKKRPTSPIVELQKTFQPTTQQSNNPMNSVVSTSKPTTPSHLTMKVPLQQATTWVVAEPMNPKQVNVEKSGCQHIYLIGGRT